MYVDDVLDLQREQSDLLNSANFQWRKWSSNVRSVLVDVLEEDRQPGTEICEHDQKQCVKVKTPGVTWKSDKDMFTVNV